VGTGSGPAASEMETAEISVADVQANGWTFSVRSAGPGDGRAVILLHGFPQNSRSFTRLLSSLGRAGYRAIAPDQRGYSALARPNAVGEYRITNLVTDVVALADSLDLGSLDLVGHDWGALVAWHATGLHPDRIRSLASVSTPHPLALAAAITGGDPDQAQRSAYIDLFRQPEVAERILLGADGSGEGLKQVFADSGADDDAVRSYVQVLCQPGALTAALNWYRANDIGHPVDPGPITVPTLYVWSTDDMALGRVAAEATAAYVQGPYRFEVLEGVNHWIPDVAHDQLSGLLLDHLETV
jgi:pimeloyl-ACP methyl ester carboxylesterase